MSRTRTKKKVEKNFPMNSWNEIEREKKERFTMVVVVVKIPFNTLFLALENSRREQKMKMKN